MNRNRQQGSMLLLPASHLTGDLGTTADWVDCACAVAGRRWSRCRIWRQRLLHQRKKHLSAAAPTALPLHPCNKRPHLTLTRSYTMTGYAVLC